MSPTAGVPICEGCGKAIRPHELASTPDWHSDCLNAAEPRRINVSCCAECPALRRVDTPGRGRQGEHGCAVEEDEPVRDTLQRPVWCPLPILMTAEG